MTRSDLIVVETKKYDAVGRTIRVESQDAAITYAYDSSGHVRAKASPFGLTTFTYDPFGRPHTQTIHGADVANPSSQIRIEYRHDQNDNRTSMKDGLGREQPLNMIVVTWRGGSSRPRYPKSPTSVTQMAGQKKINQGPDRHVTYRYSSSRDIRTIDYQDGSEKVGQVFGYDGLGHLTWCLDNNGIADKPAVAVYREHDSLGRLIQEDTRLLAVAGMVGFLDVHLWPWDELRIAPSNGAVRGLQAEEGRSNRR